MRRMSDATQRKLGSAFADMFKAMDKWEKEDPKGFAKKIAEGKAYQRRRGQEILFERATTQSELVEAGMLTEFVQ